MQLIFKLLLACLIFTKTFGQSNFSSGYDTVKEKPVSDYYSSMNDKSDFQKYKIRNLKGEMNNYSGRLHDLQRRFDEIFYGLSTKGNHRKPFDLSEKPADQNSRRTYWYDSNLTTYDQRLQEARTRPQRLTLPPRIEKKESVPPVVVPVSEEGSSEIPNAEMDTSEQLYGGYLIIHPGVSFKGSNHTCRNSYNKGNNQGEKAQGKWNRICCYNKFRDIPLRVFEWRA